MVVLASLGLVGLGGAASLPASSGCTTHQCDADCVTRGLPPNATYCPQGDASAFGHAFREGNEIVWESSTSDEPWLDYPGQRTYWLNWWAAVRDQLGIDVDAQLPLGSVTEIQAYVSTDQQNPGSNFVEASGQLAELTQPIFPRDGGGYQTNAQVNVFNATCTEYFLRVVVRLQIPTTQADAGVAPDSATEAAVPQDAMPDASSDFSDGAD